MSSKFTYTMRVQPTPKICKMPPKVQLIAFTEPDAWPPPVLTCRIDWFGPVPGDDYWHFQDVLQLVWNTTTREYYGTSTSDGQVLEMWFTVNPTTGRSKAKFWVHPGPYPMLFLESPWQDLTVDEPIKIAINEWTNLPSGHVCIVDFTSLLPASLHATLFWAGFVPPNHFLFFNRKVTLDWNVMLNFFEAFPEFGDYKCHIKWMINPFTGWCWMWTGVFWFEIPIEEVESDPHEIPTTEPITVVPERPRIRPPGHHVDLTIDARNIA